MILRVVSPEHNGLVSSYSLSLSFLEVKFQITNLKRCIHFLRAEKVNTLKLTMLSLWPCNTSRRVDLQYLERIDYSDFEFFSEIA